MGQIAALCHMLEETLRMEHIIEVLRDERQDVFICLREELARVLFELSNLNLVNKGLIDTHLAYSDFCVNLLRGQINLTLGTYSQGGGERRERPAGFPDLGSRPSLPGLVMN